MSDIVRRVAQAMYCAQRDAQTDDFMVLAAAAVEAYEAEVQRQGRMAVRARQTGANLGTPTAEVIRLHNNPIRPFNRL